MAIIRWNPLNLSSLLEDDFDVPTFPGLSRLGQGLNLYDTEDSVVAEAALPGIDEEAIDVTVENRIVRISAVSSDKTEDKSNRRYFMASRATSFNYTFRLPNDVAEDSEPKAELHQGVLTLIFPKVQKTPPKKVKVTSKGPMKNDKQPAKQA